MSNDPHANTLIVKEIQATQCTLDAMDRVREVFEEWSKLQNVTAETLAERIDRNPTYVSRILNGRASDVSFKTLARMLLAMGYRPTFGGVALGEVEK